MLLTDVQNHIDKRKWILCAEDGVWRVKVGAGYPYPLGEEVEVVSKASTEGLLKTLRAIGNGAGIAGDPKTYPDYIMLMCRKAVEEYEQP